MTIEKRNESGTPTLKMKQEISKSVKESFQSTFNYISRKLSHKTAL